MSIIPICVAIVFICMTLNNHTKQQSKLFAELCALRAEVRQLKIMAGFDPLAHFASAIEPTETPFTKGLREYRPASDCIGEAQ